jgi:methionyl aminopeptidase
MSGYKWTGTLRPKYPLSPKREVPAHIPRPDYADHRESPLKQNTNGGADVRGAQRGVNRCSR